MRTVRITVPDEVYRSLVNLASAQHTDVDRLAAGAVQALAWGSARPRERRIAEAHGRGLDDGEIGIELGLTRRQVQLVRSRMQLPPNKKSWTA